MLSTADSGTSTRATGALRLSFLSSLSSVSVAACSVGSVVVPVPRLSWSDGSMVPLFWILYCMSALLVVSYLL